MKSGHKNSNIPHPICSYTDIFQHKCLCLILRLIHTIVFVSGDQRSTLPAVRTKSDTPRRQTIKHSRQQAGRCQDL